MGFAVSNTMPRLGVVSRDVRLQRIYNGDVEEGDVYPFRWFFGGSAFWSEVESRSPTHSLLIDVVNDVGEWRSDHFDVIGGAEYVLGAWFKGVVQSGEFFLTVRWFRDVDATSFISEDNIPIPIGTYPDWTWFEQAFFAPAEALSADVLFRAPTPSTGTLYGDDLYLLSKVWTEWRYALEALSSPIKIGLNPVEIYASALTYIYRIVQFAPVTVWIDFLAEGLSYVEVYDAENDRFLVPERTEISSDTSFQIDWDGRGVLEPRVWKGSQVRDIQIRYLEEEVKIQPVAKVVPNFMPFLVGALGGLGIGIAERKLRRKRK